MDMHVIDNKMHIMYADKPVHMPKVRTTITLRSDVKELADRFELNISEIAENAIIQRVRELLLVKYGLSLETTLEERRGWDLNPRVPYGTRALQARAVPLCHPGMTSLNRPESTPLLGLKYLSKQLTQLI